MPTTTEVRRDLPACNRLLPDSYSQLPPLSSTWPGYKSAMRAYVVKGKGILDAIEVGEDVVPEPGSLSGSL